jgi:hypothetical protein
MNTQKECRFGCGKRIYWNKELNFWADLETDQLHSFRVCADIQKAQGKQVTFDKNAVEVE